MSNLPPDPLATRREELDQQGRPGAESIGDAGVLLTSPEGTLTTRRDVELGHAGHEVTVALPARLRERYEMLRQFPDPGAEADVVLALDRDGQEVVIKLYRLGVSADPDVWDRLGALSSAHVVRTLETGQAAGRDYECMEYLLGLVTSGRAVPTQTVRTVIEQVTDALDALHGAGIVHCDLKPENILIRSGGPAQPDQPLDLVLSDFGLSRAPAQSVVAASRSGTLAYLAPELMLRSEAQSSKARDWWALGVVVRELLTAERPFTEMTERGVEWSVLMSGLDLSAITDPRLRLLCQGLLTRNPANRWGAQQLRDWLTGGNPAIVEDDAPPAAESDGLKPLPFANIRHYTRASLAQAFLTSWDDATRRFLVGLDRGNNPSQAWRTLRAWLEQFDDPGAADADSLITLIDDRLLADLPPDVKMLHLIRWLDPTQPPVYRGRSMDRATLAQTARHASDPQHPDHTDAARIIRDLWGNQLLLLLAGARGAEHLSDIHQKWTTSVRTGMPRITHLMGYAPTSHRQVDEEWARAMLLLLAADRNSADLTSKLRTAAARSVPGPVDWFQRLQESATIGASDDLAVVAAAPAAFAQAQRILAEAERARAEGEARRRVWIENETEREAGRSLARGRARTYITSVAGIYIAVLLAHVLVIAFAPGLRHWQLTLASFAACGVALFAIGRSELAYADEVGGRYNRVNPISHVRAKRMRLPLSPAQVTPARIGAGIMTGCLLHVAAYFMMFAVLFPPAFYVITALVHSLLLRDSREAWRSAHAAERARMLGEA